MQASWLEAWREHCPVLPCFERNSNPETGCWFGNVDTPAVHPRPKSFPASNILAVLALKGPAVIRWNAHDSSFKNLPSRAGIEPILTDDQQGVSAASVKAGGKCASGAN